jgi:hypothetical protein
MLIASPLIAQDLVIPTPTKESAQFLNGSECIHLISNKPFRCNYLAVTGASAPSTNLYLQFLDNKGNGFIFIADRASKKTNVNVFTVVGFASRIDGKTSTVRTDVDSKASVCIVDYGSLGSRCVAILTGQNITVSSTLER